MLRVFTFAVVIACGLLFACQKEKPIEGLPERVDFNFHIQPILSNNCYQCHGPDSSSRKANLRLDIESVAKEALEDGKYVIHAGNSRKSKLIDRITSNDPDYQMPPPENGKPLSEREIALLKRWIDQGAAWKAYWAFESPQLPSDKQFSAQTTPSEKIDYLLNENLATKGLIPAQEAEKAILIRRLYYIILGLPPSPEEVQTFLADERSNAYELLVNRLLASPHFGERWARHWMDLVRYAEFKGHEFDYPILGAWQYRDYLIRAFNADVPYDQFITEHLAGDLLENPRLHQEKETNESIHGTAFYTFGEGKHSPVSIRQEEADYIDNVIDVSTKTFQSLTVACARCHDHKFDPIPTTDYYALYGIMESMRYSLIPSNQSMVSSKTVDSIELLKKDLKLLLKDAIQNVNTEELLTQNSNSTAPRAKTISYKPPQEFEILADFRNGSLNNWYSSGLAFQNQNALGEVIINLEETNSNISISKGKVSSRILGTGIQGALRSPTFIIEKDKLLVRAAGDTSIIRIIVDNFQLIQNPIYGGLQKKISESEMTDHIFDLSMLKGHKAYIELLPGCTIAKDWKSHYFSFPKHAWIEAEYVLAFNGEEVKFPESENFPTHSLEQAYENWLKEKASPSEVVLLNEALENSNIKPDQNQINQIHTKIQTLSSQLYDSTFFQGVAAGDRIESPVFIRGNIDQLSEEKVPHRYLSILSASDSIFSQTQNGRLALAKVIASPENPLTSRVMVNRIWHHLFGRGIVETVDNFGLQGSPPSHPGLLDYLAIQFVEDGWSIKKMIKHILLSNAFKRASLASPTAQEIDPQNLYLSHFNVRRLEAEIIRDGVLAVSGRLDTTHQGAPFEVYFTSFMKGRGRPSQLGELDGHGRRSVYQRIRRNFLPSFMLTFDMPAPFSTFGRRNISNVPAQSLTLMNDPFIHQQAEFWAKRLLQETQSFEERITQIYWEAFARTPKEFELEEARSFFTSSSNESNQEEILREWQDYCHTIFMMKEFIYLK